jgi:hypothetical protein
VGGCTGKCVTETVVRTSPLILFPQKVRTSLVLTTSTTYLRRRLDECAQVITPYPEGAVHERQAGAGLRGGDGHRPGPGGAHGGAVHVDSP